jgi:hypothetical protein
MPASLRGTPTTVGAILGGDPNIAVPASTVAGDLLVLVAGSSGGNITTPSGFTLHADAVSAQVPLMTRIATSGDVAGGVTYPIVQSGSGSVGAIMIPIKDWDSIDKARGILQASGNLVIPEITAAQLLGTNRYLLQVAMRTASVTFTPPGGVTERLDTVIATCNFGVAVGDEILAADADTGSRTWQPTNSSGAILGYMIAIAPKVVAADGAASGAATVAGVGAAILTTDGAASGAAAVAGAGAATAATDGASTGIAAVAGIGASIAAAEGSATGSSSVSGDTDALSSAVGQADGLASVDGQASAIFAATGAAAGSSTADGLAGSVAPATGSADGTSSASGVGGQIIAAEGSAAGAAAVQGAGVTITAAEGIASGTATADGVGGSLSSTVGTSAGVAVVLGRASRARPPARHHGTLSEHARQADLVDHSRTAIITDRSRTTVLEEA